MSDAYLKALNAAQLRAVAHDPHIPLQILAGPGSGKTRVLTCRVAHLVEAHKIRPQNICAVTFTNKAANEMRERLKKLIGPERTTGLVMGTFHALCAKYLRVYGTSIGLPSNFSICDAEESKKIITAILKRPEILEDMQACSVKIEPNFAASAISRAKAKGIAASNYERASKKPSAPPRPPQGETAQERSDTERIIGEIYKLYSAELLASNSLDFDDLLVFGVKLLRAHPAAVANLQHVLVDEFQDTNTMQFELMCLLASAKRCVSIVGDPDQSSQQFRSCDKSSLLADAVENLAKMKREFTGTQQILLEENYRSSGAILDASLAIISRDDKRVAKSLFTSHPKGPTPTLFECYDEWREANAVVQEIRRLMAFGCGKLAYNDFAILLRFNALSLHLESALRKAGIPCRIMGGHQFFDRAEVKDLIAYLQLVDNADFKPAFVRACNTPKRGLGKKSIDELLAQAERSKKSPMALAEAIVHGRAPDVKPPARLKLAPFVRVIELLRAKSLASTSAVELIQSLVSLINYEEYLKQNEDWESRWENVKQLMTFATELSGSDSSNVLGGEVGVILMRHYHLWTVHLTSTTFDQSEGGPLRQFLEGCMLSTDTQTSEDQANQPAITISTCHAAKGLEWPVVFVPAVEQEVFPFYRSEDHAEERRLLYVACTRAQGFLYISYARERAVGGDYCSVASLRKYLRRIALLQATKWLEASQTLSERREA
ncbi:UvrD-helicase-domain-containing protein [Clavulina sp. PMI_390]|nr:UvrD-helicase-domain-containing protein [Clavulina sp. PMI_390]